LNRKILDLKRIRGIANYQYGSEIGHKMFPDDVMITHSRKTGKIKHIFVEDNLLATLRPTDGILTLSIAGAMRLMKLIDYPRLRVVVRDDVIEFIIDGGNVFARHVITADSEIKPGEEVIVINNKDEILAVGKALLPGREMLAFKRGVAVKVRRGNKEKNAKD
jgi:predicted RNA-binding protein (TIGR00451 family)